MKTLMLLFFILASTQVLAEKNREELSPKEISNAIESATTCGQIKTVTNYLRLSETDLSDEQAEATVSECKELIRSKIKTMFNKKATFHIAIALKKAFSYQDQKANHTCLHLEDFQKAKSICLLKELTEFSKNL